MSTHSYMSLVQLNIYGIKETKTQKGTVYIHSTYQLHIIYCDSSLHRNSKCLVHAQKWNQSIVIDHRARFDQLLLIHNDKIWVKLQLKKLKHSIHSVPVGAVYVHGLCLWIVPTFEWLHGRSIYSYVKCCVAKALQLKCSYSL